MGLDRTWADWYFRSALKHYGQRGKGDRIKTGMTFTIEPMINTIARALSARVRMFRALFTRAAYLGR